MAIKGKAYTKTTWTFEERPVASSKLNTWDDRIEQALEVAYFLLSASWGGGDGVIRNAASGDLQATETSPPSRAIIVKPGYAFISRFPFKLESEVTTASVTPPVTLARIDLVQARLDTWDISVIIGVESSTPAAPSPGTNCLALGHLYLRPGMSVIKVTDDSGNGYIIDARKFV
jgi:hypothetical protein